MHRIIFRCRGTIKNFTNYVNHLKSIQYALTEVNQILSLEELVLSQNYS